MVYLGIHLKTQVSHELKAHILVTFFLKEYSALALDNFPVERIFILKR